MKNFRDFLFEKNYSEREGSLNESAVKIAELRLVDSKFKPVDLNVFLADGIDKDAFYSKIERKLNIENHVEELIRFFKGENGAPMIKKSIGKTYENMLISFKDKIITVEYYNYSFYIYFK